MRMSGTISLFCSLIHFMIGGTIVIVGLLLLFLDEHSLIAGIFGNISSNLLIPLLGLGVAVLQLLLLFLGIRPLVREASAGKLRWHLSVSFLFLNFSIHFIYFIMLYGDISWMAWGVTLPFSSSAANPLLFIWLVLAVSSTVGTVLCFGFLLIKLNKYFPRLDAKLAYYAQLLFILPYALQFAHVYGNPATSIVLLTLLSAFLLTFSFLVLGVHFLKFTKILVYEKMNQIETTVYSFDEGRRY